jgi:hypothetical protein
MTSRAKRRRTREEILARREEDDKRRGSQRKRPEASQSSPLYNPGLGLLYNPFRVPRLMVRRRPTIILPGRGSPASGGE